PLLAPLCCCSFCASSAAGEVDRGGDEGGNSHLCQLRKMVARIVGRSSRYQLLFNKRSGKSSVKQKWDSVFHEGRDERGEHNQSSELGECADATGGGRYALQPHGWFLGSWKYIRSKLFGCRGPSACPKPHPELRSSRC